MVVYGLRIEDIGKEDPIVDIFNIVPHVRGYSPESRRANNGGAHEEVRRGKQV